MSHLGLTTEGLREVEQRDIQVRLQELFRDRKLELENTLKNMETHYERILKASHKIFWQLYLDKANYALTEILLYPFQIMHLKLDSEISSPYLFS